MDSHGWRRLYQLIRDAAKQAPAPLRRPQYTDALIVAMYMWSVLHDRPLCWACQRANYHHVFRPRRLPSVSQFCRRVAEPRISAILQRLHETVASAPAGEALLLLDGKVLAVGPHSKDRDARPGRSSGGTSRGYRLHALATEDGRIPRWCVTPLNINEKLPAAEMVAAGGIEGLLLADGGYDSGSLYEQVETGGGHLLTPLPENAGKGHRRQSPARLRAVSAWAGLAGYVYKLRGGIERTFGHISSFGGGLGPLPAWVRTLARVRRWVGCKLIIYHVRLIQRLLENSTA